MYCRFFFGADLTTSLSDARRLFEQGLAAYAASDYVAAEINFSRALSLAPGRLSVVTNLASTYVKLGQPNRALEVIDEFEGAGCGGFDLELAVTKLVSLLLLGYGDKVKSALLQIPPHHLNDPRILGIQSEECLAEENWQAVLELLEPLRGSDVFQCGTLTGDCLTAAIHSHRWDLYDPIVSTIERLVHEGKTPDRPFSALLYLDDPSTIRKLTNSHSTRYVVGANRPGFKGLSTESDRLRIGFLSGDLRSHPVGYLVHDLLLELCNRGVEFHVIDNSPHQQPDELADRFRCISKTHTRIHGLSDDEAINKVRQMELTHLIDLNGHTKLGRLQLLAKRCAPIQLTWLGYPGTTCVNGVDYVILGKHLTTADLNDQFSERILALPTIYQPRSPNLFKQLVANASRTSKSDWGLRNNSYVVGMFCHHQKINPWLISMARELLMNTDNTALWLLSPDEQYFETLRSLITKSTTLKKDRIVYASRAPIATHLERHRHADLFIETFPYGAHTTVTDALLSGVPLLSRLGRAMHSRVSSAILSDYGCDDLVCSSDDEYVEKAITLASSEKLNLNLRERIKNRNNEGTKFIEQFADGFIKTLSEIKKGHTK